MIWLALIAGIICGISILLIMLVSVFGQAPDSYDAGAEDGMPWPENHKVGETDA